MNYELLNNITLQNSIPYLESFTSCKVLRIYDGDTLTVGTIINNQNYKFNVRIAFIDTPEIKTKDILEKQYAIIIRNKLRERLLNQIIQIEILKHDKYGRLLSKISHNDEDISKWMLDNEYAKPYYGGKKQIWNK